MIDIEKSTVEQDSNIKNLIEKKNKMLKIQEEALKNVIQAESRIECLVKEKEKMDEQTKKVTEKVFREVIKRKATTEGKCSYKIPGRK